MTLITNLRSDLDMPGLPFVLGHVYYNEQTQTRHIAINDLLSTLPGTVANTACVSSENLTIIDNLHFNLDSAKILGTRYTQAMLNLQKAN